MDKAQLITYWHNLPWNEIKQKANKYLPRLIFILLIILTTKLFAEITWRAFAPAQEYVSSKVKNKITHVIPFELNTSLKEVSSCMNLVSKSEKLTTSKEKSEV